MDLDLKELSQSIAVGGFVVFACFYLVGVCRAAWAPKIPKLTGSKLQLHQAAAVAVFLYAVGSIVEQISETIASGRSPGAVSDVFTWVLDSKRELRFRSMFEATETKDGISIRSRNVYKTISQSFAEADDNQSVVRRINSVNEIIPPDDTPKFLSNSGVAPLTANTLQDRLDEFFFLAKNRVFQNDNYNHELRDMERRIMFIRSTTFVAIIAGFVYSLFFITSLIPIVARTAHVTKKEQVRLLILILLDVLFVWFLSIAYESSSTEYNLRVFGYYRSLICF